MFLILDILTALLYLYILGACITLVGILGLGVVGTVGHGIALIIKGVRNDLSYQL